MKILIVGGTHQGKRAYAERTYSLTGGDFSPGGRALDRLHLAVRERMEGGDGPASLLAEIASRSDWIVICDEVGSGVIPIDPLDRQWREATGRLCCALAEQADTVLRISCGIALRLKG